MFMHSKKRPQIRKLFDPLPISQDLNAIITASFNPYTKILDLSQKVAGMSFASVMQAIRMVPFFHEMEHLILSHNQFVNSLYSDGLYMIGLLSPNLKTLDLSNNQLSGSEIPWNLLPTQLETLCLQNNQFEGAIAWYSLPKQLKSLFLHGNEFEGEIYWYWLPSTLSMISASKNMADVSLKLIPSTWKKEYDANNPKNLQFVKDSAYLSMSSDPYYAHSHEYQPNAPAYHAPNVQYDLPPVGQPQHKTSKRFSFDEILRKNMVNHPVNRAVISSGIKVIIKMILVFFFIDLILFLFCAGDE